MAKLNYVNRKIEGRKLGQVISKDLLKRITPGNGHKAALRDPCVELDTCGRALEDAGLLEVATSLETSIQFEGEHGKVVRLEELCLKNNQLTTDSLVALGQVVRVAARDLRDLDLSDNLIAVETKEQAAAWKYFLVSFSGCCMLRRIDFSGNPLGTKAFEVLTRVYAMEEPLDILPPRFHASFLIESESDASKAPTDVDRLEASTRRISLISDSDGNVSDLDIAPSIPVSARHSRKSSRQESKSPQKSNESVVHPDLLRQYVTTQGLRSIPYLVFSKTTMTEASALYLSYIVACHNLPDQLLAYVAPAKAGPPAQQLEAYDSSSGCCGIVYLPNSGLGSVGAKVLELSEQRRPGRFKEKSQTENTEALKKPSRLESSIRKSSDTQVSPRLHATPGRRRSTVSGMSEVIEHEKGSDDGGELDRARRRIQGNVLRDLGPQSNELWHTALKMLVASRTIVLDIGRRKTDSTIEVPKNTHTAAVARSASHAPAKNFPPALPLAVGNANQTIHSKRFHSAKESEFPPLIPIKPIPLPSPRSAESSKPASPQQETDEISPQSSLMYGLSKHVWTQIIALAVDPAGILDDTQQQAIVSWAMDKATLSVERDYLGKPDSAQIWKVLERMGCLTHDMRA